MSETVSKYFLLFCGLFPLFLMAQNSQSGLDQSYLPLSTILSDFQTNYGIEIAYDPKIVENYQVQFVQTNCAEWEICLRSVLSKTDLDCKIRGNTVLLRPSTNTDAKTKIYGHIESQIGDGLGYASIALMGTSIGTYADENGSFFLEFDSPELEKSVLEFQYLGFESKQIIIIPTQSMEVNVVLNPRSSLLDDVIISKSKPNIGLSLTDNSIRFRKDSTHTLPTALNGDLFLGLQQFPGVDGQTKYNGGLRIRGGSQDESLVLVDGIQLFKSHHLSGLFSQVNSSYIESYNLYKSIFPVQYGGKTSGILEMQSERIFQKGFESDIALGLLTTEAQIVLPLSKQLSILFSGRTTNDFIGSNKILEQNSDEEFTDRPNINTDLSILAVKPAYRFQDYFAKTSFKPRSDFDISVSGFYARDYYDYELENEITLEKKGTNSVKIKTEQKEDFQAENKGLSGSFTKYFSDQKSLEGMLSTSEYGSSLTNENKWEIEKNHHTSLENRSEEIFLTNDVSTLKGRLFYQNQIALASKYILGAEYESYSTDVNSTYNDRPIFRDLTGRTSVFSVYGNIIHSFQEKLTVNLGLRTANVQSTQDFYFSPRILLSYKITPPFTISGGFARYHQYLRQRRIENIYGNTYEFWAISKTDGLPVGHTNHFTLGGNYIWNDLSFSFEIYEKRNQNLIRNYLSQSPNRPGLDNNFGDPIYKTYIGESKIAGLDVLIKRETKTQKSLLSYTLSTNENQFSNFNQGNPFYDENDSRHQFKLSHYQTLRSRWKLFGQFVYASGNPYFDLSKLQEEMKGHPRDRGNLDVSTFQSRLPAYLRLDMGLSYHWLLPKMGIELGANVYNLTNHANVEYLQYNLKSNFSGKDKFFGTEVKQDGITPNIYVKFSF